MLRVYALLIVLCMSTSAQDIELTFKPLDQRQIKPILGRGKATVWTVSLINDYPLLKTISRERIMRAAPSIIEVPGQRATADLAQRQANRDPHNVFTRIVDAGLPLVASGATTYGLTKKQKVSTGIGLGSAVVLIVRAEVARAAPNPTPYFGDILPDVVSLGALGSVTYVVLAGYDPAPHPILATVVLP